ncbi:hypothetical protein [Micromonospora cathayae]|uniref:Acetoacetate decarboxylase (ADC) n=1 Tax=Micromonospora cathayae TaxID=3028804 RepID=A0ABY7ZH02_9ACTN|nr:hypothetical protein [Micromonospora sp. HUAS 3]WDZ82138.1 hypothetical protein PVK37_16650 [Micromonospora sp. HUAS 3]
MPDHAAAQLVVQSRMLQLGWLPADPAAVAAALPAGLHAAPGHPVVLTQYVVDDDAQTSGFEAYSVTGLGVALAGPDGHPADRDRPAHDTADEPARWWAWQLTSSPRVRDHTAASGVPARPGHTRLTVTGGTLLAVTEADGAPLIRLRVRVGDPGHTVLRGRERQVALRDGRAHDVRHPYVVEPVSPFEVESVEFLRPEHPVWALRPANPLTILHGFYSPRASFAHLGG